MLLNPILVGGLAPTAGSIPEGISIYAPLVLVGSAYAVSLFFNPRRQRPTFDTQHLESDDIENGDSVPLRLLENPHYELEG
jgi:hypothetical protein